LSIPESVSIDDFMRLEWAEMAPFFEELARKAPDAWNVEQWLASWSRLSDLVEERFNRHYIATAVDTSDKEAEAAYESFLGSILPAARSAEQKLRQRLLESGLEPSGFAVALRNMRAESELFSEQNQVLLSEELRLSSEYERVVGAQVVEWEGEEKTVTQVLRLLQQPDGALRERAWRTATGRQLQDREQLDELWVQLVRLRRTLASNAGYSDYRSFRWRQLLRFDYTPEDCLLFHEAIAEVVVPAVERLNEKRRRRLGVATLRPWDLDLDPLGRPPLAPFSTIAELEEKATAAFDLVDPEFGRYFGIMSREGLLDLENRKSKAPGGFSLDLPISRRPFIFTNAVGVHDDVQTVLHEGGHAFHTFESIHLPFSPQRAVPMEFSEVASMSMERLGLPYLDRAGFYSEEDASRAAVEDLERSIRFWPYMAVVDAFQHWVYDNPDDAVRPESCEERWAALWRRFRPGIDWAGLEPEMKSGWRMRLHIFTDPFYYVEYGLAQLGSVQIWARSLADRGAAVADYRRALALGGTLPLPELYLAAGARLAFDPGTLRHAVSLMEETIERLEAGDR
jgi:oligoendopeptidase F